MKNIYYLSFALFLFITERPAFAQLKTSAEVYAIISTSGSTPFWLQSNRHGMFSPGGSHAITRLQALGQNDIFGPVTLSYGADLVTRPGENSTLNFNQGYLRLDAYGMVFSAGRFHNTSPIHDEDLGMGSLGVSGNASPIPQLRIGLSDWIGIPFTKDFVKIRGHMAYGWLGSRRFNDDVLYHEKIGHARIGGSFPLNLYGGIAQYVVWGGTTPSGRQQPNTLRDFFRVAVAVSGDEDAPGEDRVYIIGDQLGGWDFGFFLEFDDVQFDFYRQFPLETKDNLKLKSAQDALTGISINLAENINLPFTQFVYEYLYTKYQDGPRIANTGDLSRDRYMGNENYYNHGTYKTGWVYNGRTIGNPLFIPSQFLDVGVINNRILAHHVGFASLLPRSMLLTTKATFSRNYGKRWDNRIIDRGEQKLFEPYNEQWSLLLGINAPFQLQSHRLSVKMEVAYDTGGLVGDQFGILLGFRYSP